MHLNRKQLSLLITLFSMGIMVLILFNISLGGVGSVEDEYIVEMMLAEEDIEELLKEKEVLEKMAQADPVKSHMAYNEAAKPTYGNPEPLQTLEELIAEKAAAAGESNPNDQMADGEYEERIEELKKKRAEAKQKLGEKEAEKKEFTNNLAARKTSVSYSLVDRNNYTLPPPIYTCIDGGKVVINILVDANGNVVDADFNTKSSGTSNGCLVDNAITYALKAKFSSTSKTSQKGTITYLFQGKAR